MLALWAVYALLPTLWYKYLRRTGGQCDTAATRVLHLTFDDGPHPLYTSRLLDLLRVHGVRATFFLLAGNAACYPGLVQRMQADGHQVALHGYEHANMWLMGPARSCHSMAKGLAALRAQGVQPRYFRPPYGNLNLAVLYYARRQGLELMLWDVIVQDWRANSTVAGLLHKLEQRIGAQAVILLHDNGAGSAAPGAPERTIAALAQFIPQMKNSGYRFGLLQ